MAYQPTDWSNNRAPGITAQALDKIEQGIKAAHDEIESRSGTSETRAIAAAEAAARMVAADYVATQPAVVDAAALAAQAAIDAQGDIHDPVIAAAASGTGATRSVLDQQYPPNATVGRTVESFAGTTDADRIEAALAWATATGGRLLGRPGKTYTINRVINITPAPGRESVVDFRGATLNFAGGGRIQAGTTPTAYLSTTSTNGATRGDTKIAVASTSGVAVGDLMTISSPVEWVAGINLIQTYIVADVSATTGEVWVEGRIVGDITPTQISAAGKAGSVTVAFYKVADAIHVRDVSLTGRAGSDTLMEVTGFRTVYLDRVHVLAPMRTGVNTQWCGIVMLDRCTTREHGYVNRDNGYTNTTNPPAPGGSAFGYGFLASRVAYYDAQGCHSFSGWHGFDVARGVTYARFRGVTAHKDAYGISSHEGQWVLHVSGCHFNGGLGITSRSAELVVDGGTTLDTTLGTAISGNAGLQRLVLRDLTINTASRGGAPDPARAFHFAGSAFPAHCFSTEDPYVKLENVTIRGATGISVITSRGDITARALDLADGGILNLETTGTGRDLVLHGVTIDGSAGQNNIAATGPWSQVLLESVVRVGGVGNMGGSSVLNIINGNGGRVRIRNLSAAFGGPEYLARVVSGSAVFDFISCTTGRRLLLANDASSLRNAVNNQSEATLVAGGVTVTNQSGNTTLDA